MKNWIKKIGQNKFQFFFFVGIVGLLVMAIVVASLNENTPVDKPSGDINNVTPSDPDDGEVITLATEFVSMPFDATLSYKVVRKFYEKDASREDQTKALIKYENSYRTSNGTSYALDNGDYFDVIASLSGKVIETAKSPLFGNYVVILTDDDIKTYYYGLNEVMVSKGTEVKQGEKIGVSGTSTVDQETGVHVYFQIAKAGKYLNPEKVIGTKVTDI